MVCEKDDRDLGKSMASDRSQSARSPLSPSVNPCVPERASGWSGNDFSSGFANRSQPCLETKRGGGNIKSVLFFF